MKRYIVVFTAILAASIAFQAWFLGLTPGGIKLGDPKLSNAYTEALAHGQSYLLANPDPKLLAAKDPFGPATAALMIWDTSFYRGHFYMYFGIVPFVVFMVPWMKLTGAPPSPELAILIFSVIGYSAYGGILLIAIRRYFSKAPLFLAGAAFITVIVASGTWPLMGRPAIFELENSAAYAFLALSLLSLAGYELEGIKSGKILALAAGFAALTMGCRPNYFPAVAGVGAWTLLRSWTSARERVANVFSVFSPLLLFSAVGVALAFWNYHRFGSPFDFGLKHTVSNDPALTRPLSSWANLPYHLHRYALGMPRFDRYFPFIQGQKEGPFLVTAWQEISNQVYGFLIITPIVCLAPLALFGAYPNERAFKNFCWLCLTLFFGNFLFLCSVTMSCYRYPADFLGPFSEVAAIGLVGISSSKRRLQSLYMGAGLLAFAWSIFAVILETFSTAQTTELFDIYRPSDFKAAAKPFDQLIYRYDSLTGRGPRAILIEARLPLNKNGKSEPLLVVGENGAQDFIYLYYSSPQSLQVGFEATGHGGVLSNPVKIEYGSPHKFELLLGSFLPPDEDPIFRRIERSEIANARQTLTVKLDGVVILHSRVQLHLPRAQIFYGESPFDAAFGKMFSGSLTRLAYQPELNEFLESPRPIGH